MWKMSAHNMLVSKYRHSDSVDAFADLVEKLVEVNKPSRAAIFSGNIFVFITIIILFFTGRVHSFLEKRGCARLR